MQEIIHIYIHVLLQIKTQQTLQTRLIENTLPIRLPLHSRAAHVYDNSSTRIFDQATAQEPELVHSF